MESLNLRMLFWGSVCAALGIVPADRCALRAAEPPAQVPGVVIDHSPQASGIYIGSPSIAILANSPPAVPDPCRAGLLVVKCKR